MNDMTIEEMENNNHLIGRNIRRVKPEIKKNIISFTGLRNPYAFENGIYIELGSDDKRCSIDCNFLKVIYIDKEEENNKHYSHCKLLEMVKQCDLFFLNRDDKKWPLCACQMYWKTK